ncbi:MAG: hypothetical protein OXC91_01140 [Rhodobacteraceae bacterium]|nr:hypothetical protein [Paracoccaceae bacterium]
MITLQDAVDDFYRITVVQMKTQSPNRLSMLADMCVEQLEIRGVFGAAKEISVPGIGRSKNWDVAWPTNGRVRLGISLKSILKNIAGTVPNRIDDLAGEMANVQLLSPEIATGYIALFNSAESKLRQDGGQWIDFFRDAVDRLTGRDAPAWAAGMVEASAVIEVDFSSGSQVVVSPDMSVFFGGLYT